MTFIAIANLLFYGFFDRWNFILLLVLTSVSFVAIKAMSQRPIEQRRPWLWLSLSTLLLCLSFYKIGSTYFGVILPLGISFFTFQLMGSLLDVSRGSMSAEFSFLEYVTSISFFPIIFAGPILRTQEFLPQLRKRNKFEYERAKWGLLLIANGLFKKKIADLLSQTTATHLDPHHASVFSAWVGVLALSAQFYADFSGYSDIAIGIAEILGLSIPENFHLPFLATSVAEHWRRWHISLYEWFRQYVFSSFLTLFWHDSKSWVRKMSPMVYSTFAIVITMALIGLWHAPTCNFLLWGILNGLLVAASPRIARLWNGIFRQGWLAVLLTFYLTAVIRVLTVLNVKDSLMFWREMHFPINDVGIRPSQAIELGLVMIALIVPHAVDAAFIGWRGWWTKTKWTWCLIALLLAFVFILGAPERPFLYMNF